MKKCILFILALFAFSLTAQQAKQVYITLDVSGSMCGAKYELANYTTQMIVSMCEPADEVYLIIEGNPIKLSGQGKSLSTIQQPLSYFARGSADDSQFGDIIGFNRIYKHVANKQDWLFIIGDGVWGTNRFPSDWSAFEKKVSEGNLNVCYLQTGNSKGDTGDFTDYVRRLGIVDIRKSDIDPSTIRLECDHFAKKILGFSEVNLKLEKSGNREVKFTPELPISSFLIVYQDEVSPSDLPKLTRVSANGQSLTYQMKGTPSTDRLNPPFGTLEYNYWPSHVTLSGTVWRVGAKSPIPAGKTVEIIFDKNVNTDKVRIYPIFKDIGLNDFVLVPIDQSGSLKKINDNTYSICRENSKATVYIELSDELKQKLSEDLLKKTEVEVLANNEQYPATYKDGKFECEIDLDSETTVYKAWIHSEWFQRPTPIQKIVKNDDCPPPPPPPPPPVDTVLPQKPLGTIRFEKTMRLCWNITDIAIMKILDPNQFDFEVEVENPWLYDKPEIQIQGNEVCVVIKPKGNWCECIFPSRLNLKLTATPKKGAVFIDGKQYKRVIQPAYADIEKTSRWFDRCLWVILTAGGLLLLIIYLRLLLKKNRFKKNAMINPSTWAPHRGAYMPGGGYRLRKKGFAAWFSRWFLPFDEKRDLSIPTPVAIYNFTFIATESRNKIKFPIKLFNPNTMTVTGFDPDHAKPKATHIDLHDGGIIDISRNNGTPDATMQFVAGKKNDEGGYRFFLGLFIVASLAAIAILIYLMIKAL